MKLLIIFGSNSTTKKTEIIFQKIITLISKRSNTIKILFTGNYNLNYRKNGLVLDKPYDINESDWDIIIIQGFTNLIEFSTKIKYKPILYISTEANKENQCIPLPNLFKVIVTDFEVDPTAWGIPCELVNFILIFPFKFALTNKTRSGSRISDHYSIIYFASSNDENLKVSRAVLSVMNSITDARLTVITAVDDSKLLKDSANSNINFLSKKNITSKDFANRNLVICSEDVAIIAILNKIPAFIVGVNGLGGLVCSNNLRDFVRTGFKGRIGGARQEEIPFHLFKYQLEESFACIANNKALLDESELEFCKNYYLSNWMREFSKQLNECISLHFHFNNKKLVMKLIPKVSKGFTIVKTKNNGEQIFIINNISKKRIGIIGKDEELIMSFCNGLDTIESITHKNKSNYSATDIIKFISQLWENKVIVFNLQ